MTVQQLDIRALEDKCTQIRLDLLDEVEVAGSGHYGSCLSPSRSSCASTTHCWTCVPPSRSGPRATASCSARGTPALPSTRSSPISGSSRRRSSRTFTRLGSRLGDHPDMKKVPGFDFSSGRSATGSPSLSGWLRLRPCRATTTGSRRSWATESSTRARSGRRVAYAGHRKLSICSASWTSTPCRSTARPRACSTFEPLEDKWSAFGWHVERVDGHDLEATPRGVRNVDERRTIADRSRP